MASITVQAKWYGAYGVFKKNCECQTSKLKIDIALKIDTMEFHENHCKKNQ